MNTSHVIAPLPEPDDLTAFYWAAAACHELCVQRCEKCGVLQHPPLPVCRRCSGFEFDMFRVSGRATVYSFTLGVQAFHPWFADNLPYVLAVVELEEQPHLKLVTNIVGCEPSDVVIGMAVEVTFLERDGVTLPMFRPTQEVAQ
ncbi:MAG: Zn-ribbon domain-containing OB-fold protein [Acidimicrobiia bacterium]